MPTMSMLGEVRPEHDQHGELVLLHYLRTFRLPVLDVWSACAEPQHLARWFGAVSGTGSNLTIEPLDGPIPGPIAIRVDHCRAPHDLTVHIDDGILELHLDQIGVLTNVELIRRHVSPGDAPTVGPRWQYLLDRCTAYLTNDPLPQWTNYPKRCDEYR